jgi:hypothetical protein
MQAMHQKNLGIGLQQSKAMQALKSSLAIGTDTAEESPHTTSRRRVGIDWQLNKETLALSLTLGLCSRMEVWSATSQKRRAGIRWQRSKVM